MSKEYLGIPRIGGKNDALHKLLPILEYIAEENNLTILIDACMGGMKIIANVDKNMFKTRIGNDLEPGLANLASILKDPALTKQMIAIFDDYMEDVKNGDAIPKEDFDNALEMIWKETWPEAEGFKLKVDSMDSAINAVFISYSCHKSNMTSFVYDIFKKNFIEKAVYKKLDDYSDVLKDVVIKNENFLSLLEKFGHLENLLFYIDPPYLSDSMAGDNQYFYNLTNDDHEYLMDLVLSDDFKAKVVISGWDKDPEEMRKLKELSNKRADRNKASIDARIDVVITDKANKDKSSIDKKFEAGLITEESAKKQKNEIDSKLKDQIITVERAEKMKEEIDEQLNKQLKRLREPVYSRLTKSGKFHKHCICTTKVSSAATKGKETPEKAEMIWVNVNVPDYLLDKPNNKAVNAVPENKNEDKVSSTTTVDDDDEDYYVNEE